MVNKLNIEAELNADGVTKGIEDIDGQLKSLEKTASDTGDAGAKSTEKWQTALESLKESVPTGADAAGLNDMAKATDSAGSAAGSAQATFAKFGSSLKSVASTAGGALKNAFVSVGSAALTMGRVLATVFGAGLGVGTLVGVVSEAGKIIVSAFQKLTRMVTEAGKRFREATEKAFEAGLTLPKFRGLEGLGQAIGLTDKSAEDFAGSLRKLQEAARKGDDESFNQAAEAIKRLGGSVKDFLSNDPERMAKTMAAIQGNFKKLDSLQQASLLEKLFPNASTATLSEVNTALNGTALAVEAIAAAAAKNAAAMQESDKWNKAAGESWDKLTTSFGEFGQVLAEGLGAAGGWKDFISWLPSGIAGLAENISGVSSAMKTAFDFLNDLSDSFIKWEEDTSATMRAFWKQLGADIVAEVKVAEAAIIAAWQSAVDGIVAVWDGLVDKISGVFDAIIAKAKAAAETIKSVWQTITTLGGTIGAPPTTGGGGGFRMLPVQHDNGLLRAFNGAGAQAYGAVGVTPFKAGAANDNGIGGLSSAGWDKLIFNYKALTKERKEAANAAKKESDANKTAAEDLAFLNTALGQMLKTLGLTEGELQEWVNDTVLAKDASEEWADAQLRLKAALDAGMITVAQYGDAFSKLQEQLDTGPLQTAMNDLKSGMEAFSDTAASSLADAIVNGEDLSEVFKNLAKQLASMLLQALVLKPLMNMITGGIGGASFGGHAAVAGAGVPSTFSQYPGLRGLSANPYAGLSNFAGRAALQQPANSDAAPVNNNIGDVNIDMSQTGLVAGSSEQAKKFGLQVQKAVQVVLVQESRPGGLLRRAG